MTIRDINIIHDIREPRGCLQLLFSYRFSVFFRWPQGRKVFKNKKPINSFILPSDRSVQHETRGRLLSQRSVGKYESCRLLRKNSSTW